MRKKTIVPSSEEFMSMFDPAERVLSLVNPCESRFNNDIPRLFASGMLENGIEDTLYLNGRSRSMCT